MEVEENNASESPIHAIGSRVASLASWDSLYHASQVVDVRESNGETEYYVHYIEYNKRLDEWLPESRVEVWKSPTPSHTKPSNQECSSSPSPYAKFSSTSPNQTKSEGSFPNERKLTRNLKRRYDEIHNVQKSLDELNPTEQDLEREHEEKTKIKNIQTVQFGEIKIDTWYFSPYPNEYSNLGLIFVCDCCFKYMKKEQVYYKHNLKCTYTEPPGIKIYETKIQNHSEKNLNSKFKKNSKKEKEKENENENEIEEEEEEGEEGREEGEGDGKEKEKDAETEEEKEWKEKEKGGKKSQNQSQSQSQNEYHNQTLCVYEVDGEKSKLYCQNLNLFSKLFLDHKTRNYDTEPFLFYILTSQNDKNGKKEENDVDGKNSVYEKSGKNNMRRQRILGYFSKEKYPCMDYNISCILTLPHQQRKGYGRFLIAFAYELSKKEKKIATPERPLSDLGQVGFRSYWTRVLLESLKTHKGNLAIKDLSILTSIKNEDIINTLQSLNLIKFWKGQYIISTTPKIIDEHLKNMEDQVFWAIDPEKILWEPTI